jgi:predicted patatin/cPLA2 family phospholipase
MKPKRWTLVIQGGAMRAIYAAGATEVLLENKLYCDHVYGTSAGSLIACNYVSRDLGRNEKLMSEIISNRHFVRLGNYVSKDSVFNFKWLFEEAPLTYPFDLPTFVKSPTELTATSTNLLSGKAFYFSNKKSPLIWDALASSCSMPLLSRKPAWVGDVPCLDGGVVEPIPFHKPFEDGFDKVVVITTRCKDYRKSEEKGLMRKSSFDFIKLHFKDYPNFLNAYVKANEVFDQSMDELEKLEQEGKVFVIYPSIPPSISHLEKDKEKLHALYMEGHKDASNRLKELIEYLTK